MEYDFYVFKDVDNDVTSVPMCFGSKTDAIVSFKDFVKKAVMTYRDDCPIFCLKKVFTFDSSDLFVSEIPVFDIELALGSVKSRYLNGTSVPFYCFDFVKPATDEEIEEMQTEFDLLEAEEDE